MEFLCNFWSGRKNSVIIMCFKMAVCTMFKGTYKSSRTCHLQYMKCKIFSNLLLLKISEKERLLHKTKLIWIVLFLGTSGNFNSIAFIKIFPQKIYCTSLMMYWIAQTYNCALTLKEQLQMVKQKHVMGERTQVSDLQCVEIKPLSLIRLFPVKITFCKPVYLVV